MSSKPITCDTIVNTLRKWDVAYIGKKHGVSNPKDKKNIVQELIQKGHISELKEMMDTIKGAEVHVLNKLSKEEMTFRRLQKCRFDAVDGDDFDPVYVYTREKGVDNDGNHHKKQKTTNGAVMQNKSDDESNDDVCEIVPYDNAKSPTQTNKVKSSKANAMLTPDGSATHTTPNEKAMVNPDGSATHTTPNEKAMVTPVGKASSKAKEDSNMSYMNKKFMESAFVQDITSLIHDRMFHHFKLDEMQKVCQHLIGTEKAKNVTAIISSEMITLKILKNGFNDWYPPFMHIEESQHTSE